MSNRIFAGAWLAVTALIAWATAQIEVPFSYEPIGPRAFPWVLCAFMAIAAIRMFLRPDAEPEWPRGALLSKSAVLMIAMVVYAFAFEPLGFPVATALVCIAVARIFGGGWAQGVAAGIGLGAGLYFFFDRLLEVTLPLGTLWS
ncbi:MAG TPA: tripartite tricarboxylate transporter TctB family protein [Usitatibacter sp.]|nr:tripartite tricarboxylate transporter TctB family protein [Usitatibacter sp.]